MRNQRDVGDAFNVSYGVATVAITTGNVSIATTQCAYHGISVVAGTTATADITIYDAISAATGKVLERLIVRARDSRLNERYTPIVAKYGMYIVATGTGLTGTLFFGPKG